MLFIIYNLICFQFWVILEQFNYKTTRKVSIKKFYHFTRNLHILFDQTGQGSWAKD